MHHSLYPAPLVHAKHWFVLEKEYISQNSFHSHRRIYELSLVEHKLFGLPAMRFYQFGIFGDLDWACDIREGNRYSLE